MASFFQEGERGPAGLASFARRARIEAMVRLRFFEVRPVFAILSVVLALTAVACCGDCGGGKRDLDLVGAPVEASAPDGGEPRRVAADDERSRDRFVFDLIQDLVFRKRRDGWTLTTPEAHVNVEKLRAAGVDLLLAAIAPLPGRDPADALEEQLSATEELVEATDGAMRIVVGLGEADEARRRGAIPVMVLLEGADALVGKDEELYDLRRRGLAAVGLVGSHSNGAGDSVSDPRDPGGLTTAGEELVAALRDNSLALDLTHATRELFWDVIVGQHVPAMVSHAGARALREHPRNLDDLQLLALARSGGVIGLVLNPDLLVAGQSGADIEDVVAHAEHVKSIGALKALALGTDYGGIRPPRGLDDVSRLPKLIEALRAAGWTGEEIDGLLGGNARAFFERVERRVGTAEIAEREPGRPIALECETLIGEVEGAPALACDGYLSRPAAELPPESRQRFRLQEMDRTPLRLELFGDPGTPWQVEAQNLEGDVIVQRVVMIDESGRGSLSMPADRGLTRLFLSPTRPSALREAVVWGR